MSLISPAFLLFISVVFILYYCVPLKYRWGVLLTASYVFYIMSSKWLTVFLALSTVSVYFTARLISKENKKLKEQKKTLEKADFKAYKEKNKKKKHKIIMCCIFLNFGILVVLKYFNFIGGNINGLLGLFGAKNVIPEVNWVLPLGISYYTLMAVSYAADVYYGKYEASNNLGKVALYLSFFPHITEGPIGRFDTLADKLYEGHRFDADNFKCGITLIIVGFLKKLVIADRAALYVNTVFPDYKQYGGFTLFMAGVLYTLQIYAEFSGCMDIARGIGKACGADMDKNFDRPFFSQSIGEFWRRWHITLGTWLRDYVFYPVSLSKSAAAVTKFARGKIKSKHLSKFICAAYPLFFVWLCNGLWHGTSWKYILYGLYYYIIMMIGLLCEPVSSAVVKKLKINTESFGFKVFRIVRTALFVLFGMTLFRSHSTPDAFNMLWRTFADANTGITGLGLDLSDWIILAFSTVCMFIAGVYQEKGGDLFERVNSYKIVWKYLFYIVLIDIVVVFGIYGAGYNSADFIYGAF